MTRWSLNNLLFGIFISVSILTPSFGRRSSLYAQSGMWVTAYYAGWQRDYYPPSAIDFGAFTHLCHFGYGLTASGELVQTDIGTNADIAAVVNATHAAGKKVTMAIGGWWTRDVFEGSISSANRPTFVSNIVNHIVSHNYDGVDIDMEDMVPNNETDYRLFITDLRGALTAANPALLLTAAVGWEYEIFSTIQDKFDQLNLMTYDVSGAWQGWVSWHNSPITNNGHRFPSSNGLLPCIDTYVDKFVAAGISKSKIGVGIDFYGYVWSGGTGTTTGGVTAPEQEYTDAPSVQDNVPYYTIMNNYYTPARYRFDENAGVPYLSIDTTGSTNDKFISYDDEEAIRRKVAYVGTKQIGGLIVWELAGGYRPTQPAGQRDLLLQAIKAATALDSTKPVVAITSPLNGSKVSGIVTITASASDNFGVSRVDFIINGITVNTDSSPPYNYSWNTLGLTGTQALSARAYDLNGNVGTSSTISVSLKPTARIRGQLFFDENSDGVRDVNERGLTGWTVRLVGPANIVAKTDSAGNYSFEYLPLGSYTISEDIISNWSLTMPAAQASYNVAVVSDTTEIIADFGNYATSVVAVPIDRIWNMVSLPLKVSDALRHNVYPSAISNAFSFSDHYYVEDTLVPGMGYWLKFNNAQTVYVAGDSILCDTISSNAGWCLFGSLSVPVLAAGVATEPPGIIATNFFGFNHVYTIADAVWPGKAYWVKLSAPGKLILPGAQSPASPVGRYAIDGALSRLNILKIRSADGEEQALYYGTDDEAPGPVEDRYALPPPFTGAYDVRFAARSPGSSGSLVRIVSSAMTQPTLLPITLNSVQYPLTIQWKQSIPGLFSKLIVIGDRSVVLSSEGEAIINGGFSGTDSTVGADLQLELSREPFGERPTRLDLLQNYPNPFNPGTTITVHIPATGHVKLEVYNAIGARVATLVDLELAAGEYSYSFDGSRLASGIYFYKLQENGLTGGASEVKRMLLVK